MKKITDIETIVLTEVVPTEHLVVKDTKISSIVDSIIDKIGKASAWLWLLVVLVTISSVILRYVFKSGLVALEELSWYLYGIAWLLSLSFGFVDDSHVRVGIFYEKFSNERKLWIELIGSMVLLLPFLLIVIIDSTPYFIDSFIAAESSIAPAGLSYRWIVKIFIPISFLLLLVAALSRLYKCIYTLSHNSQRNEK